MVRRWYWLIILATVLAGGTTYWISLQQVVFYEATSRLVVGPGINSLNPDINDLRTSGQLMRTYAELATSRPVLQAVVEELGLTISPDDLALNIDVTANDETQFLSLTVVDADPNQAMVIANAIAKRLVSLSPAAPDGAGAQLRERQLSQAQRIEDNIASIEAGIAQREAEMQVATDIEKQRLITDQISEQRARLVDSHATLAQIYDSLQKPLTNQIRVVEPAVFGSELSSQINLRVLIGTLAGFVLSVSIALVVEFLDDATVKTPESLTSAAKVPTLVGIADIKAEGSKLITINQPRSPISEAFRVLRTSIQFSSVDNPNRTLLVSSSIPGEGKTTTVANLAVVMAQAGHKVLLVDGDLRRPHQHGIFELPNKRGLTSLLLEFNASGGEEQVRALVQDVIKETRVDGLHLLTSGPVPPNPSELLGSTKMKTLLDSLATQFDFIIMDSPAVLSATDAAILSALADGTLLVGRAGKSRKTHVTQVVEQLQEVNANIMGFVLNGLATNSNEYGMYGYYAEPGSQKATRDGEGFGRRFRKRFQRSTNDKVYSKGVVKQ